MTTLLITHQACFEHDPGRMHPESPARLKAVLAALEAPEFAALERRAAPLAQVEQRRALVLSCARAQRAAGGPR